MTFKSTNLKKKTVLGYIKIKNILTGNEKDTFNSGRNYATEVINKGLTSRIH